MANGCCLDFLDDPSLMLVWIGYCTFSTWTAVGVTVTIYNHSGDSVGGACDL